MKIDRSAQWEGEQSDCNEMAGKIFRADVSGPWRFSGFESRDPPHGILRNLCRQRVVRRSTNVLVVVLGSDNFVFF